MPRPNILFIMTDQHRHDCLQCLDGMPVETPHIDALAARGKLFTQCCTNSPVCAPARISLASGKHPEHTGCLDNLGYLSRNHETYYQRLRDADYRVGVVGKLDLAKPDPYNGIDGQRPSVYRWGFTHPLECEGKMHAGRGNPPNGPYTAWLAERGLLETFTDDYRQRERNGWSTSCDDSPLPADAFEDSYIGQQAVRWLQQTPTDFPWHLFVSFVGPHDPFDPPAEYAQTWRERDVPEPVASSDTPRAAMMQRRMRDYDPDLVRRTRRQYYAAIQLIDDQIGAIMAALEARGETDNTYIVFSSDHGEMLGDLGLYTKAVPYEAALRVPLIVAGPGIAAGGRSDALVELSDCNPTICELAGLPPQPDIDARSFVPVLRDECREHREECLSIIQGLRLVRTRTHKLVTYRDGGAEFYDLVSDPDENDNRAGSGDPAEAELRRRMRQRLIGEAKWHY